MVNNLSHLVIRLEFDYERVENNSFLSEQMSNHINYLSLVTSLSFKFIFPR